eukprot:CAMPEP_0170186458 /NCGR_PEP_ID=MMETSP0040_2-20121228/39167_1 /TAXON_ID=641309 /ORGANISM="Lotharella oceanica, Strain CCMP622" /LENGTH=60 /DNA_ID=CAMNT_0010433207 /DNA_START=309 /DNA_END=491 /DNA_ORIENTATION=-
MESRRNITEVDVFFHFRPDRPMSDGGAYQLQGCKAVVRSLAGKKLGPEELGIQSGSVSDD